MSLIRKRLQNKNAESTQKPINDKLGDALCALITYMEDLKSGKVHNPNQYEVGSENYKNAKIMLAQEKEAVKNTILSISNTMGQISRSNLAEETFHHDFGGHYDEV